MSEDKNWQVRVMIISSVIGALLGLLAGFLYVRVAQESDGPREISTGQALKLAVASIGVVRQVAQLSG